MVVTHPCPSQEGKVPKSVIQTTEGRKDLVKRLRGCTQILRFAPNDNNIINHKSNIINHK